MLLPLKTSHEQLLGAPALPGPCKALLSSLAGPAQVFRGVSGSPYQVSTRRDFPLRLIAIYFPFFKLSCIDFFFI